MENSKIEDNQFKFTKIKKILLVLFFIIFFIFFGYILFISAPRNFIPGTTFEIEPGMTLRGISLKLKDRNIIRSRTAFEFFAILSGGDKHIKSSNYLFENKMPVYEVARLIVTRERFVAPITVTVPEGFDNKEIAEIFSIKLVNFSKNNFLEKVNEKQGYLFPDTYYFFSTDDENDVIISMSKNFEKRFASIRAKILTSTRNEKEIIIMASILEKEAKGDADRVIISGILWRRIDLGMPLQVDAAPLTYKEKGLPKNPISNPGLKAINAALYGESSAYLYYLHDREGGTHYAKTFEEHKINIRKYLKIK